jgi:CHAT domain-containing protein
LVLSLVNNPDEYDGLLGMTEAAGLRLNSDVVILSACNSAGESGKGGEGFAGMARSFLFAGSQAVVASHWQVDTRATKMLIENYGKYLKTKGRLEALEAARNVVKNAVVEYGNGKSKIKVSYAHPYFWAAFVLLGER